MTTWTEIVDEMHKRAHEHEQDMREMNRRVSEELLSQQSTFLEDFTEAEKRIFGALK